jgi:hypothetical protein
MGRAFFQKDGRMRRGGTEFGSEKPPESRRGFCSSESSWMAIVVGAQLAYLISCQLTSELDACVTRDIS